MYFTMKNNLDDITIYISTNCINNQDLAKFQIAHEIIHCLHPNHLLKYDEQIIKKAREYEPNISKIPIPLLLNICPQINHNLLNALVKPFYR